jgi:hypothetical protein
MTQPALVFDGLTCPTRHYVGPILLNRDGRVDTDRQMIRCERPGCTNILLIKDAKSFITCMATTGGDLGSFIIQCGEEQHFCCCVECAVLAHVACMLHHVMPAMLALEDAKASGELQGAILGRVMLTPSDPVAERTMRQLKKAGVAKVPARRRKSVASRDPVPMLPRAPGAPSGSLS